jgi:hypothetical protein
VRLRVVLAKKENCDIHPRHFGRPGDTAMTKTINLRKFLSNNVQDTLVVSLLLLFILGNFISLLHISLSFV